MPFVGSERTYRKALAFSCPVCKAAPGEPCQDHYKGLFVHWARWARMGRTGLRGDVTDPYTNPKPYVPRPDEGYGKRP